MIAAVQVQALTDADQRARQSQRELYTISLIIKCTWQQCTRPRIGIINCELTQIPSFKRMLLVTRDSVKDCDDRKCNSHIHLVQLDAECCNIRCILLIALGCCLYQISICCLPSNHLKTDTNFNMKESCTRTLDYWACVLDQREVVSKRTSPRLPGWGRPSLASCCPLLARSVEFTEQAVDVLKRSWPGSNGLCKRCISMHIHQIFWNTGTTYATASCNW